MNKKMHSSGSVKKKTKRKETYGDDYNTKLPEEDLAEIRRFREYDELSEEDE